MARVGATSWEHRGKEQKAQQWGKGRETGGGSRWQGGDTEVGGKGWGKENLEGSRG